MGKRPSTTQSFSSTAISAEERDLFRQEMAGVKPLPTSVHKAAKHKKPPAPIKRSPAISLPPTQPNLIDQPLRVGGHERITWRRNGVQQQIIKRLRRGYYPRVSTLDLHGLTLAQAKSELGQFLQTAEQRHWRCVLIIHGKGLGSGRQGPVLKGAVCGWLQSHGRTLAYCSAPDSDGGTGAVYALLKA